MSEACGDCGHTHTPEGCTGTPTPSDVWAGVSPAVCDCALPGPVPPGEAAQNPGRWCEVCQSRGWHHTDRHDEFTT